VDAPRCLVTGATGFVGRALVDRLRTSGAFVRGLARSPRNAAGIAADEVVVADLGRTPLEPALLHGIDTVYHLAAKTHDLTEGPGAEAEYFRTNVEGTERLLACARGQAVRRVVFASSVKAVDEGGSIEVDERIAPRPVTAYGRSKLAAEDLVRSAAARDGFESVCLRFPIIYGPGQRGNLQRMIAAVARGRFPPPPQTQNRRSMLHVDNAVEALLLAGHHPAAAGQVYFVTDSRPYSTREVYDAIRAALGRRPVRWHVPAWMFQLVASAGDLARRTTGRRVGFDSEALWKLLGSAAYDSSRITRELGYQPIRDLPGSLPEIVASLKDASR
jgi:nucleoside-diphosphate-sugar epimerase